MIEGSIGVRGGAFTGDVHGASSTGIHLDTRS